MVANCETRRRHNSPCIFPEFPLFYIIFPCLHRSVLWLMMCQPHKLSSNTVVFSWILTKIVFVYQNKENVRRNPNIQLHFLLQTFRKFSYGSLVLSLKNHANSKSPLLWFLPYELCLGSLSSRTIIHVNVIKG